MDFKTKIFKLTEDIIHTSELDDNAKNHLIKYVNECNVYEAMSLLLDGEIQEIKNPEDKEIVFERFKKSDIPNKIKYFVNEDVEMLNEFVDALIIVGLLTAAGFTAVAAGAVAKKIKQQFEKCHHRCKKLQDEGVSTPQYQLCREKCKFETLQIALKKAKSINCSKAKNPEKCKEKQKKNIEKLEKKIKKTKQKINDYKQTENINKITTESVDKSAVKKAAMDAAKDIHGKPDEKIIDSMIEKAMKKGKDTEDVIQIVINMMRSD